MKNLILLFLLTFSLTSFAKKSTITLTSDNFIHLNQAVTTSSIARLSSQLLKFMEKHPDKDEVFLVLDSPGGSVNDGRYFLEFVNSLPIKVHTISLFSASMAYVFVQGMDIRYATSSSILMSHRVSLNNFSGEINGDLETKYKFFKAMSTEIDRMCAKRLSMSLRGYQNLIADELWMTGKQALVHNHIDFLVNLKCSEELYKGRFAINFRTFFGTVKVEYSKCPLINTPLSVNGSDLAIKEFRKQVEQYRR